MLLILLIVFIAIWLSYSKRKSVKFGDIKIAYIDDIDKSLEKYAEF